MRIRRWIRPKLNRLNINLGRFKAASLIARPFVFVDKVLALRDLTVLQNVVMKYCPPIVPPDTSHSWFGRINNMDFLLYRAIITILDGKKTLDLHFGTSPGSVIYAVTTQRLALVVRDIDDARLLYRHLTAIQDSSDFQALISAYREIGYMYRKTRSLQHPLTSPERNDRGY